MHVQDSDMPMQPYNNISSKRNSKKNDKKLRVSQNCHPITIKFELRVQMLKDDDVLCKCIVHKITIIFLQKQK